MNDFVSIYIKVYIILDFHDLLGRPTFKKPGKMRYSHTALALLPCHCLGAAASGWNFVQNGTSGILALEAIIVSPTLALFFDRASNDPLVIDGAPAWGALWNMETNTATPIKVISDTFCASGAFLSNGSMVS